MGQYYHPTFIEAEDTDQVFYADPLEIFDSFSKLMETSWWQNPYVNALLSILKKNPCVVAWMGDYADDVLPITGCQFDEEQQRLFFSEVWGETRTPTRIEKAQFIDTEQAYSLLLSSRKKRGFLVNHTKKTYFDLNGYWDKYIEAVPDKAQREDIWLPHPLPLLTAVGNGQGGGDYYSDVGADKVGTWAFDTLEWTQTQPDDSYTDETTLFLEKN